MHAGVGVHEGVDVAVVGGQHLLVIRVLFQSLAVVVALGLDQVVQRDNAAGLNAHGNLSGVEPGAHQNVRIFAVGDHQVQIGAGILGRGVILPLDIDVHVLLNPLGHDIVVIVALVILVIPDGQRHGLVAKRKCILFGHGHCQCGLSEQHRENQQQSKLFSHEFPSFYLS